MTVLVSDSRPCEVIFSIRINGEEKEWIVKKKEVQQLIINVSQEALPDYIERCLLIGDIVINYATIQTSEECITKYFGSISTELREKVQEISTLKQTVESEITKNLPQLIKEKIELEIRSKVAELQGQIELLKEIRQSLPDTIKAELSGQVEALRKVNDQLPTSVKSELQGQIDSLKTIKDQLPTTVQAQLDKHIAQLEECIEKVKTSSDIITKYLSKYGNIIEKGRMGELYVYDVLVKNFKEDSFEIVSKTAESTDILAKESADITKILIEVKNYQNNVPKEQVGKFWRDLQAHDAPVGCFVSLGATIQGGIGDYKIETNDDKIGVFVNAGLFGESGSYEDGVKLSYFIARKFAQNILKLERGNLEESELRKRITKIMTEMGVLKSKIEKISLIRKDLRKIEVLSHDSIEKIDSFKTETMEKIALIMTQGTKE